MKKLILALNAEVNKRAEDREKLIDQLDSTDLRTLSYLLPKGRKAQDFAIEPLKLYLHKRSEIARQKDLVKALGRLSFPANLEPIQRVVLTVEWKRSAMWGKNPNAEAFVYGLGHLSSGSIGGCGYDKLSTAVASVLNQIPQFLELMYKIKDKNPGANNGELFGYGSGYGILPSFEGGVGVSCYPQIFEKIGYIFRSVASTLNTDVYEIVKK